MTCIRAWVRRGLAEDPECIPITEGRETAWLTLSTLTPPEPQHEEKTSNFLCSLGRRYKSCVRKALPWCLRSREHSHQERNYPGIYGWELYTGSAFCGPRLGLSSKAKIRHPTVQWTPYTINDIVKIRVDLSQIFGRLSDFSPWSLCLSSAVERTMKHLQTARDIKLKRDEAPKTGHLNWSVNAVCTRIQEQEVQDDPVMPKLTAGLVLQREGNVWKMNSEEADSIIALWSCTIDQRARQGDDSPKPLAEGKKGDYSRVIGHTDNIRAISIMDWLEYPVHEVDPDCLDGTGYHMRKRPLRRQIEPGQETREIAIKAAHTLQQACALELLSFYMSAIASQQSQIGGTTDVMPHPLREYGRFLPRDQWHPGSVQVVPSIDLWKNTAVDSLASIIVDAGLVETIAEANLFVIPALFEYDLLPEELGKHELDNQPDKDKIYDSEPPESIPSFSDLPPPFLADSQGHGTIPSAVGERMTQRSKAYRKTYCPIRGKSSADQTPAHVAYCWRCAC